MAKSRFKESIQFKFLSVMFIIMFITAIVASAFLAQNERKQRKQSLVDKGQSLASYMAKLSKDPLIMRDFIQLDGIVKEVNKDPEVAYALVKDMEGKGRVFVSQGRRARFCVIDGQDTARLLRAFERL